MTVTLGWHWLGQLEAPASTLEERDCIVRGLLAMASAAEMVAVEAPMVERGASGWVGMLLLAESHASIHCDAATGRALVDLFSCRAFDVAAVERAVATELSATSFTGELLERRG